MYIETSTEKIETNILFVFISTFIKEILLWWGMHQDIVLSISSECPLWNIDITVFTCLT